MTFSSSNAARVPRRRRTWLGLLGLTTALSGVAVAGGASVAATHQSSNREKVLVWGQSTDPQSLWNATDFNATDGAPIMSLINQGLLSFDAKNQLVPALASSWKEVSPTKYVYTIRKGVKFSDGHPLTAADVVYSIDVQRDPSVASDENNFFTDIKSVKASGDTVTVELSTPDALWAYIPAHEAGYVYEKSSLEGHLKDYGTPGVLPIGTGPYKVQSYVANSEITLVRNPYYWGPKPYYDKVVFDIIPDPQTLFLAMRAGKIDGTFDVPTGNLPTWKSASSIHITTFPADGFYGLTLDETEFPFSNIHVRKAIAYAMPRGGMEAAIFGGTGRVAKTLDDPRTLQGLLPNSEIKKLFAQIPSYSYDIAKAKKELAKSPVPKGFSTTLNVAAPCSRCVAVSQALKASLAQIGINVTLNMMAGPPRFQYILAHGPNLGIQLIGNVADVPDPIELPWLYYASDQAVKGGNNSSNFKNPQVDSIIQQGLYSTDFPKVALDAIKVETMAARDVAMVPLVYLSTVAATYGRLHLKNPGAFFMDYVWINQLSNS